ncbi:MAG: hypothetical protein ACPGU7_13805 [Gammaproteobacteria bacterium]
MEDPLGEALEFMEASRHVEADTLLREATRREPHDSTALLIMVGNLLDWVRIPSPLVNALLGRCEGELGHTRTWAWLRTRSDIAAGDWDAALARVDPECREDTDNINAFLPRARIHLHRGHLKAAERDITHALNCAPLCADGLKLQAALARRRGDEIRSTKILSRALSLYPWRPRIRLLRGLGALKLGDLETGWSDLAHVVPFSGSFRRHPPPRTPIWTGEQNPDLHLLIISEQGLGDAMQLGRFLPWARQRVGRLTLACQPTLHRLFAPLVDAVIPLNDRDVDHDAWAGFFHLPRLHQRATGRWHPVPRYLEARVEDAAPRRQRATGRGQDRGTPTLSVGLVWAGNPDQLNDRHRSMNLEQLHPLLDIPGTRFRSFQLGTGSEQVTASNGKISPRPDSFGDFLDDATAMAELDLLISVDTSVAHLAGAIGQRTWVLLSHAADWRWEGDEGRSAWYPEMRLYRQTRRGDWTDVIEHVARDLEHEVQTLRMAFDPPGPR